jgi:site-specific DNA-cytosine methylase
MEPINSKTPSKDDPFYRYLLEVVHNGITHREFQDSLRQKNARTNDVQSFIERAGHTYEMMADWMGKNGYEDQVDKCLRKHKKLVEDGGNIMRRGTIVPKDYIGAFVGHYPSNLTHPYEDRYITYREALAIMGMPDDYELLDPKKSANHICQNVPVQTAMDMVTEVKEALEGNRNWLDATYVFQNNNSQKYEIWDEQTSETLERFFA